MSYDAVRSLYCYRYGFVCRHSNATVRIYCLLNVRALQVYFLQKRIYTHRQDSLYQFFSHNSLCFIIYQAVSTRASEERKMMEALSTFNISSDVFVSYCGKSHILSCACMCYCILCHLLCMYSFTYVYHI